MKTQNLITAGWIQIDLEDFSDPTSPDLFASQAEAVEALKDHKHVILNAPTGWGKTLVMSTVLLHKLKDTRMRGIIAVPQTVIGTNFVRDWRLNVGGRRVDWIVNHNLCSDQAVNTVSGVIAFLETNRREIGDRLLVCTHATLSLVYAKLKASGRLNLFRNLFLWIDEAHHVKNARLVGGGTISNSLGSLIPYCTGGVGLATATFVRGDNRHILTEKMEEEFVRFDVPYDVYFNERQPVESFEFNVACGEPYKSLSAICRKPRPTIIYLAKRQSSYATECKYVEVKKVIKTLAAGRKITRGDIVKVGSLKILDLVTEKGRDKRKALIGQANVIIALDTCKEGFDWPEASRCVIFGERHSVPEMIQMMGRLFRRSPDKNHAEFWQIMPTAQDRDSRNAVLTVIFSAMLLEDVLVPVAMKRLSDYVPSTDSWQDLIRDFISNVEGLSYEDSLPLTKPILKKHGIDDLAVWDNLWKQCARTVRRLKGLTLDVPFEILIREEITDGILKLVSGLCGKMTFAELRDVIGRAGKTPEEWVVVAEKLAKEHGILPNKGWLQKNGYAALCQAMRNHPELFEHVPQTGKNNRSIDANIALAEKLSKEHGTLPHSKWLRKNGYNGLHQATRKYPELFEHIQQARKSHSPGENVALAEKLAKEHGLLPNPNWLIKNGYSGLNAAIWKYPELFEHIQQDRKFKTPEEHVADAEKLTKENSGLLPNYIWLKNSGYSGLPDAMRNHPELFEHIQRARKCAQVLTIEEYIATAEKLATENGGSLPNCGWLINNGYKRLYDATRRSPNLFKHIKQSRKIKTPEEHVADAENLVKEHGTLPNPGWLTKNGYKGLYHAMRTHPELFRNFRQDSIRDSHVATAEKLALENGGLLPSRSWLLNNGYGKLYEALRRNPKLFKHIKQERPRDRNVALAEKLAKENGGLLPSCSWLLKNGYSGLYAATRVHPELFEHFHQNSISDRHVATAEKLAKENGGLLPSCSWLLKNGYGRIVTSMRNHPELFKHIKQARKRR